MPLDSDDIIEIYPWASSVSEDTIEDFLTDAYSEIDSEIYGDSVDRLAKYYTAHKIFLEIQNNQRVTNSLTSIRAEKTVNGSINFEDNEDYWLKTSYGADYIRLKTKLNGCANIGMRVI